MEKIRVLVTGVGGGGHGEQILKALKLSTLNLEINGADMSSVSKGLAVVDRSFILPAASHPEYMDALIYLCKKLSVQALFHGSEPELKKMSENEQEFHKLGIFLPINPKTVIQTCMDKVATSSFLKTHGFNFPQFKEVKSLIDVSKINFFPVVLKPSIGGGGSANTFIAQDANELEFFSEYILRHSASFIVQEYVGTPDSEYTVGVLSDYEGNLINSIAVKRNIMSALSNRLKVKNRSGNKDLGEILVISSGVSQGEIGKFKEVTSKCEKIAKTIGSRCAINIQCRFYNNEVYVFEINPRFSGTTSLRAMVGYNEPDVLLRKHILGEQVTPFFEYKEGTIVRGLDESFISKDITIRSWRDA